MGAGGEVGSPGPTDDDDTWRKIDTPTSALAPTSTASPTATAADTAAATTLSPVATALTFQPSPVPVSAPASASDPQPDLPTPTRGVVAAAKAFFTSKAAVAPAPVAPTQTSKARDFFQNMEKKTASGASAGGVKKKWYSPYLAALSNADKVGGRGRIIDSGSDRSEGNRNDTS